MEKNVNPGVQNIKSFVQCNDISPIQASMNDDLPPPYCGEPEPSQRAEPNEPMSWLTEECDENKGLGSSAICDPMQRGWIVNDLNHPERDFRDYNQSTIYRYSKALRGGDEAVTDLFRDIVVLDIDGKAHPVPILWGSQERAVAAILQHQVRKDNSLVVDRPILPMLAVHQSGIEFNTNRYMYHKALDYISTKYEGDGPEYEGLKPGFTVQERFIKRDTVFGVARGIPVNVSYTLIAWAMYVEEMNQILEQIILKFSPIAYIRVRGVSWEVGVKLDSIANNLETEPGEKQRVVKFQFNMTAESFIPQPIVRKKAALRERVSILNSIENTEVNEVISRLEIAVKELSNA